MDSTDAELLQRYSETGSEDAFAEVVRRQMDFVFATAVRQVGGDTHLACDVCQYVFTQVARRAGTLATHRSLKGWLYSTASHAAANVVRTERRRRAREIAAQSMHESAPSSPSAGPDDLHLTIDQALTALNDREREAVILRFLDGREYTEIGARFSVTADAARLRVERALEKMRIALARRGIVSTTAAVMGTLASQAAVTAPPGLAKIVTAHALQGAAVAGAATSFTLMVTTSKAITGIAALVAVFALGVAFQQAQRRGTTDAMLASLRLENDAVTKQRDALQSKVTALASAAGAPAPRASLAASPAVPPPRLAPGNARQRVLADPSLRPLFLAQRALEVRSQYDPFFAAAGVSADRRDKLVDLLVQPMRLNLDLDQALAALGANPDPAALAQIQEKVKRQTADLKVDASEGVRQLLGDAAYAQYQAYRSTLTERDVAQRLAGQFYQSKEPVSAAQGDDLVAILAQAHFDARATAPAAETSVAGVVLSSNEAASYTRGAASSLGALITDAAIARAQTVLTAAQLSALKRLQAQQLLEVQLQANPARRRSP